MRKIMLMAEYGCYPLWDVTDGIAENISPRQLKLSDTVMIEINNWDEDFQNTFDDTYPPNSGFETKEKLILFEDKASKLMNMLKSELHNKFEVEYKKTSNVK